MDSTEKLTPEERSYREGGAEIRRVNPFPFSGRGSLLNSASGEPVAAEFVNLRIRGTSLQLVGIHFRVFSYTFPEDPRGIPRPSDKDSFLFGLRDNSPG